MSVAEGTSDIEQSLPPPSIRETLICISIGVSFFLSLPWYMRLFSRIALPFSGMQDVASGVNHMNAHGFVHSDLKFGNVIIVPVGSDRHTAKVTDLGMTYGELWNLEIQDHDA